MQNIAIIGFMAVGKSAIGRNLAKKLRRRFVDLDRLIERAEGSKVSDIFAQKGEAYFRQLEKRTLMDVLQKENQVIATGGGVVMDDENLSMLQKRALLIGLTANLDILLARAGAGNQRPLLQGGNRREKVQELLSQREARYAQADLMIDTSEMSIDQVVETIIRALDNAKNRESDGKHHR